MRQLVPAGAAVRPGHSAEGRQLRACRGSFDTVPLHRFSDRPMLASHRSDRLTRTGRSRAWPRDWAIPPRRSTAALARHRRKIARASQGRGRQRAGGRGDLQPVRRQAPRADLATVDQRLPVIHERLPKRRRMHRGQCRDERKCVEGKVDNYRTLGLEALQPRQ